MVSQTAANALFEAFRGETGSAGGENTRLGLQHPLWFDGQRPEWPQSSSPSWPGSATGRLRGRRSSNQLAAADRRGASEPVMPGSRLPA
jgi:hypothetical protein